MPAKALKVGPRLTLPADVITQSIALLAVRRAGKSNAAAVMAEEMYRAGPAVGRDRPQRRLVGPALIG